MQKEIEAALQEVRQLEDRILERMIEADEIQAAVQAAEAALVADTAAADAERRSLEDEARALEREAERAAESRRALVAELPAQTLSTFDLLIKRRGVAVAEARDGHCALCHVRLRPQFFNEVRRNDAILQCDSCQRILYFKDDAAAEPAAT
jgi:predicted  nucleic acid-binding Zn-ribbon protein